MIPRLSSAIVCLLALAALTGLPHQALAQGSRADYERAAALASRRNRVTRSRF